MKVIPLDDKKPGGPVDPLDALIAQAGKLDTPDATEGGPEGEGGPPAAPAMTNQQCLMLAYEMIRDTLCAFAGVTSPKLTMAAEKIEPVAEAQAAVLDKYGINLSAMTGDYMVEIKAAIVTVPMLLAVRGGLMVELAAAKEKKQAATSAPAAVTAAPAPAAAPAVFNVGTATPDKPTGEVLQAKPG